MKVTIDFDNVDLAAADALLGTGQWGDTREEVIQRAYKQRIWQICGDALAMTKIGVEPAPAAANQVTHPEGRV